MATAPLTTPTFSDTDIELLSELRERFAETTRATARTRRERLAIIIEGFRLFQSHGGYSGEAAHALYEKLEIVSRVSDARKAAMAITGENPSKEQDPTEKNRMYGRVRTVAGILLELEKDEADGIITDQTNEEIIGWIEQSGGWREYGEQGDSDPVEPEEDDSSEADADYDDSDGQADDDEGDNGTEPGVASGKAAKDDPELFDVASCRRLIEQTGITATPSSTIVAPTPRVALICGSEETNLLLMPLTGVPADLLQKLQAYRPGPDEHASKAIKAWGHITTALQLFDRVDSAAPVDAEVEPYAGQDVKPSLPGIVCDSAERFTISASRQHSSMVVGVTLEFPLIVGKGNLSPRDRWVHGKGTNSLIRNLSSAEHRSAYLDPELVTGAADTLKVKFKTRDNYATDRKKFTVELKPFDSIPADYWLLAVRGDLRLTSFADCDGDFASQADLLKFAAAAGAAKSLKKIVKVEIGRSKELSLALGRSKRNLISGCSARGEPANCDVTAQDFARAIAFGQAIGAQGCQLAIEPNGLLLVSFSLPGIGEFQVAIPTLHEGKRERALLRRVPR